MPFRTAISGMRAAQVHLETIGHNVANANTAGFKQGRAEFADIYAVSQTGTADNIPGSGVTVSQISQQFGQGNISTTDNAMDLAIDGDGFFVLEDQGSRVYSRAGAFGLDKDGFIVNAQNQQLITYQADSAGNITGAEGPMQITSETSDPVATTSMSLKLNLDANAADTTVGGTVAIDPAVPASYNNTASMTVYDSLGNSHLATFYYQKTATANTWNSQVSFDGGALSTPAHTLAFTSSGALDAGASTIGALTFNPTGAAAMTLASDYSGSTQFGSDFSPNSLTQDGNAAGLFSGISIDSEGSILANYSFGKPVLQGQVVLSKFPNPQGLAQLGDNSWVETGDSGAALRSAPGSSGVGTISAGSLEDSNVDLTEQLVAMIVAQRNFQANAQVISTADTLSQTVINIR
ncbi:MAG: flagellar hook protein FlgE [Gammaproteobacteria bacterium]